MEREQHDRFQYGIDTKSVEIADSVILDIATKVIQEEPGVHALSPRFYDELVDGIAIRCGQKTLPGINIKHRKGFIELNVYVKVYYGYNVIELSKDLQCHIIEHMKEMLDLEYVKVDVHIEGIVDPSQKENTEDDNETK